MNMVHQKISHTHVYRASAGFSLLGVSLSLFFGILFVLILCLFTPALGPTRVISDSSRDVFQTEVVVHHLSSTGTVATVWMTDIQGSQKVMTDEIWTDGYDNVLLVNAKSIKDLPKIGKYKRIEIAGDISTGQKVALWYIYSKKQLQNGESYEEVDRVEVRPFQSQ
jgi:hypothetical protein